MMSFSPSSSFRVTISAHVAGDWVYVHFFTTVAGAEGPAKVQVIHILVDEPSVVTLVNKAILVGVSIDAMALPTFKAVQSPFALAILMEQPVTLQPLPSSLLVQNKSKGLVAFDARPVLL